MIQIILDYKDAGPTLWLYVIGFCIAVVVAMCCHEYAHARVAYKCGDDTAKVSGRMTLNPLAHIDLLGMLSFVLVGFGWAKPVPINPVRFKEYRKGIFLTSVAGVITNFVICFFASGLSILFLYFASLYTGTSQFIMYLLQFLFITFSLISSVNFCLCIFNLLPIYPLDGFNVLQSVTKGTNRFVDFLKRYGTIILVVLLLTTLLETGMGYAVDYVLAPIDSFWFKIIYGV